MDTVLLLIAFLTEFGIASVLGNQYQHFTKTSDLTGQTCNAEDVEFTKTDVSRLSICASFCSLSETCDSVFYAESTLKCHGCGILLNPLVELAGSVHYQREMTRHMYIGCYADCYDTDYLCDTADGRVMRHSLVDRNYMTEQMCFKHCLPFNLPYFGLQNGNECWCSDEGFRRDGVVDRCHVSCIGNASQICGGPSALSVFRYAYRR